MTNIDEMEAELATLRGTIKLLCATAYLAKPVAITFGIRHSIVCEVLSGIERSAERCWNNFHGQPIDSTHVDKGAR